MPRKRATPSATSGTTPMDLSEHVNVRLSPAIVAQLDWYCAELTHEVHAPVVRSEGIRRLLVRALREERAERKPAP